MSVITPITATVSEPKFVVNSFPQTSMSAEEEIGLCTLPFNNPEVLKENFLAKITKYLDPSYSVLEKFAIKNLPRLPEKQLIALIEVLGDKRILRGRDQSFEVTFTLAELFNYLLQKSKAASIHIENVELVGSSVPWILNEYIYSVFSELGFDNPNTLLSEGLVEAFAQKPRDFDFRISVPNASFDEIHFLRDRILEFFVEKNVEKNPSIDKRVFCLQLTKNGFTVLTEPKQFQQSLVTTVGIIDACSSCGIDIVIAKELTRNHLFIHDSLRLNIQQLIEILKIVPASELIEKIKTKTLDFMIVPHGDIGNGIQAMVDRLAGIIRAIDIQTINCAGWGALLIGYLKGKRCLDKIVDLEKMLLDKLRYSFEVLPNEAEVPLALYHQLISWPNSTVSKKMAITTAYWIKKTVTSHLGEHSRAAFMMAFQACLSLKLNGYEESIDEFWLLVKDFIEVKPKGICGMLHEVMNSGLGSFKVLIAFLEVKLLLYMNTTDEAFQLNLILHNNKAAMQINTEEFHLLIPFECKNSLSQLIEIFQEINLKEQSQLLNALDKLDALLQPKSPYTSAKLIPERHLRLVNQDVNDHSKLLKKLMVEWTLVCEVQFQTTAGSKLLERWLPDLLAQYDDPQESLRLILGAKNKHNTPEEKKLYGSMNILLTQKDFADFPIRLLWAMALTATEDPARCFEAHQIWNKYVSTNSAKNKHLFTKLFIRKLTITRPDLALEVFNGLSKEELPFEDVAISFTEIQSSYKSKPLFLTQKNRSLLVKSAVKIHSNRSNKFELPSGDLNVLLSLVEMLISQQDYVMALELAETVQIYPQFLNLLKHALPDLWENKAKELIPSHVDNILTLLSQLNFSPANRWKHLFEKIKMLSHKALGLKAWNVFYTFIQDTKSLQGTSYEIAEAWVWAIKAISINNAQCLIGLLGHEKFVLNIFNDPTISPIKEPFLLSLYENLLQQCEGCFCEDTIEQLLKFRKEINDYYNLTPWIKADLRLAERLSSGSISLQISAFNIYVGLVKDEEAEKIVCSILNSNLQGKEIEIVASFLVYFSRLPKNKCPNALTMLLNPNLNKILACSSAEAIKILLAWFEKMEADNAINLSMALGIFKHLLNLATLPGDSHQIISCADSVISLLDKTNALPKKSNLKTLLATIHEKFVKLLECNNKWLEMFSLMTALKRISINFMEQTTLGAYSKMFFWLANSKDKKLITELYTNYRWFQDYTDTNVDTNNLVVCIHLMNKLFVLNMNDEAESLVSYFFANLKNENPSLLIECGHVYVHTCQVILNEAICLKKNEILIPTWHFVWNLILTNRVCTYASHHSASWDSILCNTVKVYPQAGFQILNDISALQTFLTFFTNANFFDVMTILLTLSASNLSAYEGISLKHNFQLWINAETKLKSLSPPESFINQIGRAKTMALILAGDSIECEEALQKLERYLFEVPESPREVLQMSVFLWILLTAPSERIPNLFNKGMFNPFIDKICRTFLHEKELPYEIIVILDLFSDRPSFESVIQFIEQIWTHQHSRNILQIGCLSILRNLKKREKFSDQQKKLLSVWLDKFLKEMDDQQILCSYNFFYECIKYPTLDYETFGHYADMDSIYEKMISITFLHIDKSEYMNILEQNLVNENFIKFCTICISKMKKYSEESYKRAFCCLIFLLGNSLNFDKIHANFMDAVLGNANSQNYYVRILFIKMLLDSKMDSSHSFLNISNIIKKEFICIINMMKSVHEEFRTLLNKYVFLSYIKEADEIARSKKVMDIHYNNLTEVVIKTCGKKLLKNSFHLFQYKWLLNRPEIECGDMTFGMKDKAIQEMVDRILIYPTEHAGNEIVKLLINQPSDYCFSPTAFGHCVQRWIQVSALTSKNMLDIAYAYLIMSSIMNKFKTPEWKFAIAAALKSIFRELTNPASLFYCQKSPVPIVDICFKTSEFLSCALNRQLFEGQIPLYVELTKTLMHQVMAALKTENKNQIFNLNNIISDMCIVDKLPSQSISELKELWSTLLKSNIDEITFL